MNVTKSNIVGAPQWDQSYRFTDYFHVPSLSINSHLTLLKKMREDEKIWKKALFVKYQEGPKWEDYFGDEAKGREAMCDYESSTITQKAECLDVPAREFTDCFFYEYFPLPCKSWQRKVKN
eukprot:TRINITY_DN1919_c0_g2_i3.p2 TRINITY_DN1919_c0_g2~~TRINITY_DN1919_c0_g2_i3.p2  ORF type:complete len:121 (-),score=41.75 TRINITY_DN1919_c0_g2_i3:56-418(-)